MSSQSSKGYKGTAMEGIIATFYARNTLKDIQEYRKAATTVAENLAPGSQILDLAPGPGYLAIELARLGDFRITGLDISRTFVEIARKNAGDAGFAIDFRQGNASEMPFGDDVFDFIVCRAAFKNFSEPVEALDEMSRVLKPGGKAVIFDLRADASVADIERYVDNMGVGWLNALLIRWTFKSMLLKRAYTQADFENMVSQSRFEDCEIHADSIGLAVWLEK